MAIADALALLKIAGPLVAMVPIFGPQLEGLINVANELCGLSEGIQSNREGFVNLAQDAITYAAAVAETVQKSHSLVPPRAIAGESVSAEQIRPAESTSTVQVHYSQTHLEALTETLKEIEKAISERKEKDAARAKKFASGFRRAVRDTLQKGSDQETLKALRAKLDLAVKAFSIAADVRGADILNKIVEHMQETSLLQEIWQEEEREERIRREAEANERRRKKVFETEKHRREEVLKHLGAVLTPVHDARYNSSQAPSECMANTRVKLLAELESWIDSDGESIYWLSGLAGTGKSTIARSLCTLLAERGLLAASFFVSRNSADRRDSRSIARTLAFQLAFHFPATQEHIHSVLVENPDIPSRPVGDLLTKLIVDPLTNLAYFASPPLIVIDAFDECDTQDGYEGGNFLSQLLVAIRRRSLPLRLFVTSRPHPSIEKMFNGAQVSNTGSHLSLKLHNIENSIVQRDIELYFQNSFKRIALKEPELADQTWPEPSTVETLVARAGVLFIYAATVVRYVGDPVDVPSERLRSLLTETSRSTYLEYEMLDDLYLQILKGCVGKEKDRNDLLCVRLRVVAGSLVHLQDPLSLGSLSALLNVERAVVRRMLESLSPLLIYDLSKPVQLFHPSFPDFINNLDRCRDPRFHIAPDEQHTLLALRCLSTMNQHLKYDICDIRDPSLFNSEVSSLPERLTLSVPAELAYACKHWMAHLARSSLARCGALLDELRTFAENHLLHWVEALSLLREVSSALRGLPDTIAWCRTTGGTAAATKLLLSDTERTIQEYYTPISASALQVYHSSLTFMPHCSLQRLYINTNNNFHIPRLSSQRDPKWSPLLRALEDHDGAVNSVAFSRDGTRLASGSDERTARVWDLSTGNVVATLNGYTDWMRSMTFSPDGTRLASSWSAKIVRVWDINTGDVIVALEGHESRVNCVAFSPDGARLASGSDDTTARVWDVNTGNVVAKLSGHHRFVISVAFSPDGTRLASGSSDMTVRAWDVTTGNVVATLKGHDRDVCSVVFSPDGTRLASGSRDKTVRVWDANTGDAIATFKGHGKGVNSVAFSPDGTRLGSGSFDRTVRVWDVSTGSVVATLKGHDSSVSSVAFSPDGNRLASGSDDKTVRVWDVNTGGITAMLNGHDRSVTSAAFSIDGTRLASGSSDATVCIWDVSVGNVIATLKGHGGDVYSVAFSLDGTRLASGSRDKTVRVWDVNAGDVVATLNGHTDWVRSVAISPDGARLASGADDMTVRVWDVSTGNVIAKLEGHTAWVLQVSWSRTGSEILSRDRYGDHRTWHAGDDFPTPLHSSASISALPGAQFTFRVDQQTGWAFCTRTSDNRSKRVCWVPTSRRPVQSDFCLQAGARVAMGAPSGTITILDLTTWLSTWMSV